MIEVKNETQLIEYATDNKWAHLYFIKSTHYFITPQGKYLSAEICEDGSLRWGEWYNPPQK